MVVSIRHRSHVRRQTGRPSLMVGALAFLGLCLRVCRASQSLPPVPYSREDDERLVDCSGVCSAQLDRVAAHFRRYAAETGEYLEAKCHELRRLARCLGTLSSTMHLTGNPKPMHRSCRLDLSVLAHLQWAEVEINTTCANVPEAISESMQTGSCRVERRALAKRCEIQNLTICQLFGDRHLLRGSSLLETCLLRGSWPMIQLPHFFVWASNVRAVPRCPSLGCGVKETTDLQTLQIAVRPAGSQKFVKFTTSAQDHALPWSFDNGQKSVSMAAGGDVILWVSNDSLVAEISIPDLCTLVIVRLFDNHITVAALVPADIASRFSSSQLCTGGCPPQEFVARYTWKPDRNAANNTFRYVGQDVCSEFLSNKPPIFLAACRWDVALRSNPEKQYLTRQFVYSSALAAQDQACLLGVGGKRTPSTLEETGEEDVPNFIRNSIANSSSDGEGQLTSSAINYRTSRLVLLLCACVLWGGKVLVAFEIEYLLSFR